MMQRLQALDRMHTMCQVGFSDCETASLGAVELRARTQKWGFMDFGAALPSFCH